MQKRHAETASITLGTSQHHAFQVCVRAAHVRGWRHHCTSTGLHSKPNSSGDLVCHVSHVVPLMHVAHFMPTCKRAQTWKQATCNLRMKCLGATVQAPSCHATHTQQQSCPHSPAGVLFGGASQHVFVLHDCTVAWSGLRMSYWGQMPNVNKPLPCSHSPTRDGHIGQANTT
jgi:hypothetical protein